MGVTIKDVAKLAGVSFKTVSRVVNNESSVSERARSNVQKAIKALDYKPNTSARMLRGKASLLALVYDNPNSYYVVDIINGALKECRKNGYELIIFPCRHDDASFQSKIVELGKRHDIAGLIITPPFSEIDELVTCLLYTSPSPRDS